VIVVPMLDKMKLDDVVGAIPVHLVAGFWGTMAVPFYTEGASFGAQILGFAAVGGFVFVASAAVWTILKVTVGLRPSEEDEILGLDKAELGLEAYPEFRS
jgi:Amt family ammonium transporter